MNCPNCGKPVEDPWGHCPACGAALDAKPGGQSGQPPAPVSKREFYRHHASKSARSNVRGSAILSYVVAGISLVFGLLMMGNPFILVDVVIIVLLGLGVQLLQSRVCAILLLVYSVYSCLITTLTSGQLSGWWLIIAGICAVMGTFKLQKEYRIFCGR